VVLDVSVRPSRRLALLLLGTHAGALVLALAYLPGMAAKVAAAGALCAGLCWSLARHALLLLPGSVRGIQFLADGSCRLAARSGRVQRYEIAPATYVMPWLVVLCLRDRMRRRTVRVTLLPDSVERASFRRLRVRLRWGKAPAAAG
jgi:toxin CptA